MLKQVGFLEIAGKTVVAVGAWCETVAIVFTDGTFAHFEAQTCYDSCEIADEPITPDRMYSWHVGLGIATQEEIDVEHARVEREQGAQRELAQRREYERLKAKFAD